jgi:hypothetical protein
LNFNLQWINLKGQELKIKTTKRRACASKKQLELLAEYFSNFEVKHLWTEDIF